MDILQQPSALSFSGNLPDIIIETEEPKIRFFLSVESTQIFSETYIPDSDGRVRIPIKDLIEEYLEIVIPNTELFEQVKGARDFTATIEDDVNDPEIISFTAIKGGVDRKDLVTADFVAANLLTWQPQVKTVKWNDLNYLSYYAQEVSSIKVKAYFPGGIDEEITLHNIGTAGLYSFETTFSKIREEFEDQPIYFDIWAQNEPTLPEDIVETFRQRYILTDKVYEYDDHFVFENSLGGLDSVRFTGEKKLVNSAKFDLALYFDQISDEYQVNPNKAFEKNTGYFQSKAHLLWAQDFFNSRQKYLQAGELLTRILTRDPELTGTDYQLTAFDFEFLFTEQTRFLDIDRSVDLADILVIIGPDEEQYYLVPRLYLFPEITDPTKAIFPVQEEGQPGWKILSFQTLMALFVGGSSPYINVDDFGAIGDGTTDDTTAWNAAVTAAPAGSVIVGTKGKTYLVTTVATDKEITFDLTGITVRRSTNIAVGMESHIFTSSTGAFPVTVRGGKVEFTGSMDDAVNGKINGLNFQNDRVFVLGTEITGCSWCGIQAALTVKDATFIAVESHDNGYAGIWGKGNRVIGVACLTHRNGGYNGIDGYGFVVTHQTESEDEYVSMTACQAFGNMTRGLDSHSSRGSVIITASHAVNNGAPDPKWGNVVAPAARQIHCVNRFNACQIKDNYVRSEYATGALINVTAEESFTFGLKKLDIQGNICDVVNSNSTCYGISVQFKKTEKLVISNNTINHIGTDQVYSIVVESVPGADGWFKDAIIFNNICDRGIFFRCEQPVSGGHRLLFSNGTYSTGIIRFSSSTAVASIKIKDIIIKERQLSIHGHSNLLSSVECDGVDVDSIADSSAFEAGIHLLNLNGTIRNSVSKNAWAQGIIGTGGRIDAFGCQVIKPNRGKLSASHAGIDTTGSIDNCYVDNEDVDIPGSAYGFGFRISAYDLSKSFSGNSIKISTSNFLRANMSAIGLGTNDIFTQGILLTPADRRFRFDYTLNPRGIFRFLDEVQDDSPNLTDGHSNVCVLAIDRTLTSISNAGSTNVNVSSTSLAVGDRVGLLLDDNTYHWTWITAIPDGSNITIQDAIPVDRSANGAVYLRRWRGYGFSRNNFPNLTALLSITGEAGTGNALPTGVNYVNVVDGLSNNYPSAIGTSLIVKINNNRTFEIFANTEGVFWMRSLHGDATDNVWHKLLRDGDPPSAHTHTWDNITGKPTQFTPTAHSHAISDITGLEAALKKILRVTFHADAGANGTLTNAASTDQFLANSNRNITLTDLAGYTQVRFIVRVVTNSASVNTPRLELAYKTGAFSTTVGDYLQIGTSAVECSLAATGLINSGWIDLAAGAIADNILLTVKQKGGDGAADPAVGIVVAEFR
ncbi:hypothetical protein C943_03325 [Mariniradius saccharolyticus AK6]|uniref:Pectate lyase superfamily protein domain-containing protein n=1 Tax=Mariniradius saccharolyticus AK6 TaxID=1239962 RepID=M7XJ95_9BACT|nr:hypothetical protein [Mariniradius saccharolyticus]EMS34638.1 hypothetical protein C943_03325 [Mariniradius saccharolyticus AK6]